MGPQARKSAQTRREVARRPDATEKGEWRKEGREGREGKRQQNDTFSSRVKRESVFSPRPARHPVYTVAQVWPNPGYHDPVPV